MCGICGIIGKRDEASVAKMLHSIKHRGPDDRGVFHDENLSIGMVRLSIIDISENAHQPMSNEEQSIWIVYNGEMYNYKEEKLILEQIGVKFRSTSDTEVVLKMYEKYGMDFLNRIRGMFSLAIFDRRFERKRIILARDPFGIKPLLYSFNNGVLIFASEMKAMLQCPYINKELDYEAIRSLIIFGSLVQPYTMIQNVKMLLPAHSLIFENGKIQIKRYTKFEVDKYPELKKMAYSDQLQLFKQIFSDSVKSHMISDVPIGAFLSGGMDSSLIVAHMAMHSKKVITFCVGYDQEGKEIDESDAAQKIADFIGTEHYRTKITLQDFRNHLSDIIRALDQPSIDGVNSYFVSMAAKKYATVAISGTGGDEFFFGYPWLYQSYNKFNKKFLHHGLDVKIIQSVFKSGLFQKLKNTGFGKIIEYGENYNDFLFYMASYISTFRQHGANRVFSDGVKHIINCDKSMAVYLKEIDETTDSSFISKLSMLSFRSYTQNQLLRDIDATSSAHSIEVRVPFIDQRISDFSFSLPDSSFLHINNKYSAKKKYTYHQTGIKRMLADIGRDILPKNMDVQQKKGFQMPFGSWLRTGFSDIIEEITSQDAIRKRGLFNIKEVQNIKQQFFSGKESWGKLWLIMVLELWCREFID